MHPTSQIQKSGAFFVAGPSVNAGTVFLEVHINPNKA